MAFFLNKAKPVAFFMAFFDFENKTTFDRKKIEPKCWKNKKKTRKMWKLEKSWNKLKQFQNNLKEKVKIEQKYWKNDDEWRQCEYYAKKEFGKKWNNYRKIRKMRSFQKNAELFISRNAKLFFPLFCVWLRFELYCLHSTGTVVIQSFPPPLVYLKSHLNGI